MPAGQWCLVAAAAVISTRHAGWANLRRDAEAVAAEDGGLVTVENADVVQGLNIDGRYDRRDRHNNAAQQAAASDTAREGRAGDKRHRKDCDDSFHVSTPLFLPANLTYWPRARSRTRSILDQMTAYLLTNN